MWPQAVTVEAEQQPHQFLRRCRGITAHSPQGGEQFLDPGPGLLYAGHPPRLFLSQRVCFSRRARWSRGVCWAGTGGQVESVTVMGECTFSSTLPLPRYMCTPQGRHGS